MEHTVEWEIECRLKTREKQNLVNSAAPLHSHFSSYRLWRSSNASETKRRKKSLIIIIWNYYEMSHQMPHGVHPRWEMITHQRIPEKSCSTHARADNPLNFHGVKTHNFFTEFGFFSAANSLTFHWNDWNSRVFRFSLSSWLVVVVVG